MTFSFRYLFECFADAGFAHPVLPRKLGQDHPLGAVSSNGFPIELQSRPSNPPTFQLRPPESRLYSFLNQ